MKVAVVGAGAIGGFVAAALARSGVRVGVVARGTHLQAIRHDGLRVRSDLGSFVARVDAAPDLRELGAFDVLILAFKAHQWPALLPQLRDPQFADSSIVTLQNGVPFWYVRRPPLRAVDPGGAVGAVFDDARTIGGVVHVSGRIEAPGRIVQSGGLRYVLGGVSPEARSRAEYVANVFQNAGLLAEVDQTIRTPVWLKLVNNVGLNAVSTLTGSSIREMLDDPERLSAVRALMHEALAVGQAMGVVADVDIDARLAYAARLDDVRTSMLQDYDAGKALEIDPMLGAVVELAERCRVATPRVREAYARLQQLAAGSYRG
jgi:2-dehydropantoate 2-reductase